MVRCLCIVLCLMLVYGKMLMYCTVVFDAGVLYFISGVGTCKLDLLCLS